MKKQLLLLIIMINSVSLLAQVPTHVFDDNSAFISYPALNNVATKSIPIKKMQPFDTKKLLEEDRKKEKIVDAPFRFGYDFDVNYTLEDGVWEKQDTVNIWSMKVSSSGAYSLNFIFERLLLAEGAQLYIYNTEGSMVYGPVMNEQNSSDEFFLSDLVSGDEVVIRLIEPISVKRGSYLKISKVVHAYVNMFPNQSKEDEPLLSCHKDISCYPEWINESDGVALVLLASGKELCSGCLLNNTRNDYRPYFLTAFHCADSDKDGTLSTDEKNAAQNWKFRFQFKKASCNGSAVTSYISYDKSFFRAAWIETDFLLLELEKSPAQLGHSQITYLGWDRSGSNPSKGTGIHHPKGIEMKISFDKHSISTCNSLYVGWRYYINSHWVVEFDEGAVQSGSSGSPLFDQNKRVVGQAHSVYVSCPPETAFYGQFHRSWDGGGTSATRLRDWLDPINPNNTGPQTHNFLRASPPTNLTTQSVFKTITVSQVENVYPIYSIPSAVNYKWEWSNSYSSNDIRILNLVQNSAQYAQVVGYKPFSQTGMAYTLFARPVFDSYGTTTVNPVFIYTFQVLNYRSYVTAYPNPVSDVLNIKINEEDEQSDMLQFSSKDKSSVKEFIIKLHDGLGNMLQSEISKGNILQFNVSKYPTGYYYLHIYDNINKESKPQQIVILKQ